MNIIVNVCLLVQLLLLLCVSIHLCAALGCKLVTLVFSVAQHRCVSDSLLSWVLDFFILFPFCFLKPGTHWWQSWIQRGRLCWTGKNNWQPATELDVCLRCWYIQQSWTFDFVADLLPVQQSCSYWIKLCCQCVLGLAVQPLFSCWFWVCCRGRSHC